ncbi:MAG: transketolase C-terminal domain-containing protein [Candidatus Micrarchaeota archaeon]
MDLADWRSKIEWIPGRFGYGDGLLDLGKTNEDVMVLCCDLAESTRVHLFAKEFPHRFIECGVAEQNMAQIAVGLALEGRIPFISSYAVFSPGRNWDQIRIGVCYNDANVKLAGAHAGLNVGEDGATHQALEDVAIMRVLPNVRVEVPCDYWEARKTTVASAEVNGPVYFRFGRGKGPVVSTEKTPFEFGKAEVFRDGSDVAILACGPLVYEALVAADELERKGVSARVINNHSVKPLDAETIGKAARDCGCVVTVEDHQITGGMGGAVAEFLAKTYPVAQEFVGMPDSFGESGAPSELYAKWGLTSAAISAAAEKAIKRK